MENQDEKYMRRVFTLVQDSLSNNDYPFGALIVKDGEIIAEDINTGTTDITGHAEVNVIKKAVKVLKTRNLSGCTLYSNFEPCAMCSFVARDCNISRVVFSVLSPHWGGYSRWNILSNEIKDPLFTSAQATNIPEILPGVLKEEGEKFFDELNWNMHIK